MKNIVITGGFSGFGKSLSHVFLKNGCKVIITSRGKEKFNHFISEYSKYKDNIIFYNTSLSSENQMDDLITFSEKKFNGKLDCIINNASISLTGRFKDIPFEEYKEAFNLNFLLISYQIKKLINLNLSNKVKIVNILGGSINIGIPYSSSYSLTKLVLKVFTEVIKMEDSNLDLILFHPGPLNAGEKNRKLFGFKKNPIRSFKKNDPYLVAEKFYKDLKRGKKIINYSKFQNLLLLVYLFFPRLIKWFFK
jgi:short-subunit dehydrogenase